MKKFKDIREDRDWERKPKQKKFTNNPGKHKKSLYNMLSDLEEDFNDDEFDNVYDDIDDR